MSELFSEVYGCYYGIVSRILSRAKDGISQKEIDVVINEHGFSETAFHLLPELIGGEWDFLTKRGDLHYSKFSGRIHRPLTGLELSWLAALIRDPRVKLFLSGEKLKELSAALSGIVPAFDVSDSVSTDRHLDGDRYEDTAYIANFREILKACKNNYPLQISYDGEKAGRSERTYHPYKLCYSGLNDKFRLLAAVYNPKTRQLSKVTLNLARVISVSPSALTYRASTDDLCKLFSAPCENPPIVLEITKERNALERFLLQFASFDRKTEYDPERDIYTCQISYDMADETELLIRILSFGPTIKVLGPQSFLAQVKDRVAKQLRLLNSSQ